MTSKMGLKEVVSKDKTDDLFKDQMYDTSNDLLKDDIQKWVKYKFFRFRYEKNIKKIQNENEGEMNQVIDVKALDVTKKHMLSFGFDKFDQADQAMIDGFGSFSSSLDFQSKDD